MKAFSAWLVAFVFLLLSANAQTSASAQLQDGILSVLEHRFQVEEKRLSSVSLKLPKSIVVRIDGNEKYGNVAKALDRLASFGAVEFRFSHKLGLHAWPPLYAALGDGCRTYPWQRFTVDAFAQRPLVKNYGDWTFYCVEVNAHSPVTFPKVSESEDPKRRIFLLRIGEDVRWKFLAETLDVLTRSGMRSYVFGSEREAVRVGPISPAYIPLPPTHGY